MYSDHLVFTGKPNILIDLSILNIVYTGTPSTGSLENNEDPDEMQHNAAFHLGMHCLLRIRTP